jgi:Alpha/beta hydrolase family
MEKVVSNDGTTLAFDRTGSGPPVIVVGGAFSYRRWKGFGQLAELLAPQFTVLNYDRRGRGDSGDTRPYAVEREIEDLEAVIEAARGSASVIGFSSGAILGARAAVAGLAIERLALYEPPFLVDDSRTPPPADFAARLDAMLAADRRGEAVGYFMREGMGIPGFLVSLMRFTPFWSSLKATAHTLPYDWALLGDSTVGAPLRAGDWAPAAAETLVMSGERSPAQLRNAARALAEAMPRARHRALAGQSHNVKMRALAPVLTAFFSGSSVAASNGAALGNAAFSA